MARLVVAALVALLIGRTEVRPYEDSRRPELQFGQERTRRPELQFGQERTRRPELQFGQERAVFSSKSDLVVLHVSVLDRKSGFVPGLPREAFTVREDGKPQSIRFFQNEDTPVTVGLVMDSSASMLRKRPALIAAGLAFAASSRPDDELFAVHFNEHVWAGLPPDRPFTSDAVELRAALQRSTSRGQTALFDAIAVALDHLKRGSAQKKILIVISDGGDNASVKRFADVLDMARRSDAVIYGIGLWDEYDSDADPDVLKQLARATGADAYFPRKVEDVTKILERIARDIRSGYTIGYAPSSTAAGYHAVQVEVASGGRRFTVRARSGYVAGAGASNAAR
jgi:Ca-activated chloride channel homolog